MANMEMHIDEPKFYELCIQSNTSHLNINVDKCISASLMITYNEIDVEQLLVHLDVNEGSHLTLMFKHDTNASLNMKFHANIMKDAFLKFAYCDLNKGTTSVEGTLILCEEGASADIRSACIVSGNKYFQITCHHQKPYTTGLMEHYAVVQEGGHYRMKACGQIEKGARESVSHQVTRVLTMSEHHDSEVIPLLLIDENNVKASHATTLGQPDENQLYYLQTRGLSRTQALGLLSVGYIMPVTQIFDDQKRNEELKNEIEMKVGLHA